MDKKMMKMIKNSDCVVIPAYEPEEELVQLVGKLKTLGMSVIVVDDGSGDSYEHIWRKISDIAVVLHHPENQGKGAALKTAFAYILNYNAGCKLRPQDDSHPIEHIVTADADGQHLPKDIQRVIHEVYHHPGELVLGVRAFDEHVPARSKFGNNITKHVFSLVSRTKVHDTQTGLRGFSADLLTFMLSTSGDRYEYEMNMLLEAAREKIHIDEVTIDTVYLDEKNSCSHFHTVKDSLRIYGILFKFAAASFVSFLIDYVAFVYFAYMSHGIAGGVLFSNIAARLLSASVNYRLNQSAVFHSEESAGKTLPKYAALAVFILMANSIILTFYIKTLGISPYFAKICTEITLFVISLSVQTLLIFNPKKQKKTTGELV